MTTRFVVPEEMKKLDCWVAVKLVKDEDHPEKKKKIPFNVETNKPLSGAWHSKFGWSFNKVKTPLRGFVLRQENNISIIDLDYGNDPTHPSYTFAQELVKELHTFTEVSQSGKGLHLVLRGHVPSRVYEKETIGMEIYSERRFFLITGKQYNGYKPKLVDGQKVLDRLFKQYGEKTPAPTEDFNGHRITVGNHPELADTVEVYVGALADHRADDREEWLEILFCLHAFFEGSDQGLKIADNFSRRCPQKYTRQAVEKAWASAKKFGGKQVGFSRLEQRVTEDHPELYGPSQKKKKKESIPEPTPGPTVDPEPDIAAAQQKILAAAKLEQLKPFEKSFEGIYSATEAWTEHAPPQYWVEHIIVEEGLTMLYGDSGSKKSWLLLDLLVNLALGTKTWLGFSVMKKMNVLLIDEENGKRRTNHRLFHLFNGMGLKPGTKVALDISSLAGVNLTDPGWLIVLENELTKGNYHVVALDALVDVTAGADENAAQELQPVFSELKQMAARYHVSFVILHHTSKGTGEYRGSTSIRAAMDVAIKVVSRHEDPYMNISFDKGRDFRASEFGAKLEVDMDAYSATLVSTEVQKKKPRYTGAQSFVITYLTKIKEARRMEIVKATKDYTKDNINRAVRSLIESGTIEAFNPDGKKGNEMIRLSEAMDHEADGIEITKNSF